MNPRPTIADAPAVDPRYKSHFRLVEANEADAAYIHGLRVDPILSQHLNPAPPDVAAQLRWLEGYKTREREGLEYYFIIVSDGQDAGVVRMYDFRELEGRRSFCWGSWILPPPRRPGLVVFSALLIYELGFEALGFEQCHFDVRRENTGVIAFHERAGAKRVAEDDLDAYFRFMPEDYRAFRETYARVWREHRQLRTK